MDRNRFELLLDAYGADMRRWPANERAAAASFAAQEGAAEALLEARQLDAALDAVLGQEAPSSELSARILARRPQGWPLDRRALMALAACAVLGLLLGFGGGQLAPAPDNQGAAFFAMAFEAPPAFAIEDEG
ncbi:MAG: hypothetical protein R3C25_09815 [Hyphomonadaceae bacterium]